MVLAARARDLEHCVMWVTRSQWLEPLHISEGLWERTIFRREVEKKADLGGAQIWQRESGVRYVFVIRMGCGRTSLN